MPNPQKKEECCEKCKNPKLTGYDICAFSHCPCHLPAQEKECVAQCKDCNAQFTEWNSDSKECPECEGAIGFAQQKKEVANTEPWWSEEFDRKIYPITMDSVEVNKLKSFIRSVEERARKEEREATESSFFATMHTIRSKKASKNQLKILAEISSLFRRVQNYRDIIS
jgi:hypothetical protein